MQLCIMFEEEANRQASLLLLRGGSGELLEPSCWLGGKLGLLSRFG